MAAPARLSEQKLEDRIFRLLKLSSLPQMRRVLEEAAQLSSAGQDTEAGALVEKAEAMYSLPSHQAKGPEEVQVIPAKERVAGTVAAAEQSFAARIAADLANGLTSVLLRAIEDLDRHMSSESDRLSSAFGQRLDKIQSSVESLQPLHAQLDHLVQNGAAVQEKFDELAATTASLREAQARLDNDVTGLRLEMALSSASTANRVEDVCARMLAQDHEISTIQENTSGLASKLASAAERLERQANAIRTIHESHRERTLVLGQVSQLLHCLEGEPLVSDANAL